MCNQNALQQKIRKLTGNGDLIANFLADTLEGKYADAKFNHRLEAARHLIKYGFSDANCDNASNSSFLRSLSLSANREQESTPSDGEREPDHTEPVEQQEITHLDILNYEIAHLIRSETAEGHTIVNFLVYTMTGRDRPFTAKKLKIKPADRMAAARELLRRGFGDLGSRRKQSDTTDEANAYDTLHTDLAKRMREYSEGGTDTVRFLLEVMSDPDPDLEFTIHHRMSAAQELLRRGWDTNYDNIKPEHLQAYWRDKESSRLSIGQKKTQAGLSTTIDDYDNYDDTDYEAIAKEMREEEDRDVNSKPLRFQETVPSSRHSSESRNLEDRQAASPATKPPLPQGEGWGEGTAGILDKPLPPRREKSLPPAKAGVRMGVMEPVSKTLPQSESEDATISNSSNIEDKNIYDYNHNDPDPAIDYYFEPLNPEEQALFDYEARLESGDFPKGEAPKEPPPPPPSAYAEYSDTLRRIKDAAAREGVPVLPNPLAGKLHAVKIRSP